MSESKDAKRSVAFVAGATGFTGREVVRALVERGIRAVAHVRPDSSQLDSWRDRFAAMGAEVDAAEWEESAMTATLSRLMPTHVFALLGTTRARMRQGADPKARSYATVDYGLTALLLRAAIACGSRPGFVYLSAAGVKPNSRTAYHAARARAEAEIITSGLPYLIARPSFITGPGRDEPRPGERYGSALIDALLFLAGRLGAKKFAARYASTTNLVLAQALVRLALDPASKNKFFESESLRNPDPS